MAEKKAVSDSSLRRRLQEAEDTLAAIRAGEVDAVVVEGPHGQQVYTLESPDEPFRIFVEKMQEGAITLTSEGTILYCNRFFSDLLQRPLEQVRGQPIQAFAEGESGQRIEALLRSARAGVAHGECQLRTAEGQTVPVQLACNRLPAENADTFGIVVTDLSARERARRLEAERHAAEQANAARDQFLAVVSHELRTPLNAILGWTQVLLREDGVPEAWRKGLETIERNAWSQTQLVNDLLDVSRVLAGKLRLDPRPVQLHAVVDTALATIKPSADSKRITLERELGSREVVVNGDAERLQQVVGNLLSNAVKFTPEDGEVHVSVCERDGFAEIEVRDTGVGIRKSFLPKLFELYHQIEDRNARRSGGLGLGLAIVRQLTELHGGEVRADSDGEGRGARFTVRLPMAASRAAVNSERADADAALSLDGLRVLLVEDEEDGREVLTRLLEGAGAAVIAAACATDALELLSRDDADVMVSDIGLPDVDGHELIRRVRASGRSGRELPAVAVTAYVGREDRRRVLLAGFQAHLAKPVDRDELLAIVASLAGHVSN